MANINLENKVKENFDEYLNSTDWRVKENSNSFYNFGGLNKYIISKDSATYWKTYYDKFDKNILQGHNEGRYHIHDLGSLSSYCFGASLKDLLLKGVRGVPNVAISSPAKRLRSITSQIANIVTIFQNEVSGAIAFSSVNTYLAPFIYFDKLKRDKIDDNGEKIDFEYNEYDLEDITESMQNMVYALNSNSRMGSEPAFSNFTMDFFTLKPMQGEFVIIGGEAKNYTYSQFQKEADILLDIFSRIMTEGDAEGNAFAYPIPTFNISKSVDFDNPAYKYVWESSAKFGIPYFANFITSELQEDDVRSMCCRLRLDLKELIQKTGGLFGAGENTGSIGVFTVNLPMLGYKHKGDLEGFYKELDEILEIGKEQLCLKKKYIIELYNRGLYPALKEYTDNLETMFLTIGMIGGNELCRNFSDDAYDITDVKGKKLVDDVLEYMLNKLREFQEETKFLFNLEATPAEGATYRLAKKSKEKYPDIVTAGEGKDVYFTNSVHLPVGIEWNYQDIYSHQEHLLSKFTGGSVYHNYLKDSLSGDIVKEQIKTIFENYEIPYISNSPLYGVCPEHGYTKNRTKDDTCPICGKPLQLYQRVTGYIRRVDNFNIGKHKEFLERNQKNLDKIA